MGLYPACTEEVEGERKGERERKRKKEKERKRKTKKKFCAVSLVSKEMKSAKQFDNAPKVA